MTRDTYMSFSNCIRVLKSISADHNWVWVLSGVLQDLSEDHHPIPFIEDSYDIKIKLCDIEQFAVNYLVGSSIVITAKDIASIIDKECATPVASAQELDDELDELLGGHTSPPGSFMNAIPDTDGNFQLGREKVMSLRFAIMKMADALAESGCTLSALSLAFRSVKYDGELSSEDADALAVVATAQAVRACDNVVQIRTLLS